MKHYDMYSTRSHAMPSTPKRGACRNLSLAESATLHLRWRGAAARRLRSLLILRNGLGPARVDHTNHAQRAVRHAVEWNGFGVRDGDGPGLLFSG